MNPFAMAPPPDLMRQASGVRTAVSELLRVVRGRNRDLSLRYGLSESQGYALLILARSGPMTVTGLGDHLYLEKSTASRLAKGLLKKGMLRRRALGRDGRVTILQLTESGQRTARKMENELFNAYLSILEGMGPQSRESLAVDLQLLAEAMAGPSSGDEKDDPRRGYPPEGGD